MEKTEFITINELKGQSSDRSDDRRDDINEQSDQRQNSRLLIKDSDQSTTDDPIIGYAQEPLLSLIDACTPLIDIVEDIIVYAKVALDSTPNEPADGLTRDESASIHLYTMEWDGSQYSLYTCLNHTLKSSDRKQLRPWFKYLKLFLTAVVKIPCNPPQTVWRGVKKNSSDEFPKGVQIIWWPFSSTTTSLDVLKSDLYLGKTGERTLFSIEIINGRSISAHSHYDKEEEILLLPGTFMEVQSQLDPAPDLHVIHLKQLIPDSILLEPPFEGARLYPKTKRSWYTKKRFLIPISILIIACILAAVLGGVLGYRRGTKKQDSVVNWNGNNWASGCDFHDNSFLNVTTLPGACGPTCAKTSPCTHFTWTSVNGGTCFLKKGNMSRDDAFATEDPSMVCGLVYNNQYQTENSTILWNINNWAMYCDFINNDLMNITTTADRCGPTCAQTQDCTHFTWTAFNGGTCFLKKGNVSTNDAFPSNDSTAVCGIINENQHVSPNATVSWNGQNWAMSCDFVGNDISNVVSTGERCSSVCAQTQGCTHYTWTSFNGGTCWMKGGNVTKNDAFFFNDPTMVCGIIDSK